MENILLKSSKLDDFTLVGTVDEIAAIQKLDLPLTDAFRSIVLENRALIDVRAPVEFEKGSFPRAVNFPLMNNEERHLIGIRYKEQGNASAVLLGKELVGPEKEARVLVWKTFVKENPDAYLYCFRGGQRSQISQAWLKEVGVNIPRLKGGYKAFRSFLMLEAERISSQAKIITIGGRTGSGKTLLLHKIKSCIDLEGLANHRGSSFGRFLSPQPSQINFEDALAYALIKHEAQGHRHLILEDESHNIGQIYIPKPIFENLKKGGIILLKTSMKERIEIIFEEYVSHALKAYAKHYGNEGNKVWFDDVNAGLDRIKKRIGNERHVSIKSAFHHAFLSQEDTADASQHKGWIEMLLREYYDPMYDYQLEKSEVAVLFEGSAAEILVYLEESGDLI